VTSEAAADQDDPRKKSILLHNADANVSAKHYRKEAGRSKPSRRRAPMTAHCGGGSPEPIGHHRSKEPVAFIGATAPQSGSGAEK